MDTELPIPEIKDEGESQCEAILEAVASSPRHYPVPRKVSRKSLEHAFLTAFELIGGVPRLALWAHSNPAAFYNLTAKLFPQQLQADVNNRGDLSQTLMGMPVYDPSKHIGRTLDVTPTVVEPSDTQH